MQRFCWDNSYSVGVKSIDEQHKVWIERLNSLSAAIESHQGARQVSKTLDFMMDYVEFHFAAEESLMEAKCYPAFAQHKQEHQQFRATLMDLFVLELNEEDSVGRIADSINNFQVSWLKNHIQQTDRKLAAFLRERDAALCGDTGPSLQTVHPTPKDASPNLQEAAAPGSPYPVLPKNPTW